METDTDKSLPLSREAVADEILGLPVPFALAAPKRPKPTVAPTVSFALVFACGALVAMAADRVPRDPVAWVIPSALRTVEAVTPATVPENTAPVMAPTPLVEEAPAAPAPAPEVGPEASPEIAPDPRPAPRVSPRPRRPVDATTAATEPAAPSASRATRWDTGDPEAEQIPRSLDALLDDALGGTPDAVATAAPTPSLPTVPTRGQVLTTLRALEGEVRMCGEGASGVLNATLVVSGSSGTVSSVRVSGDLAGTSVSRCAAAVIGSARFPHFSQTRFEISFPYRV